MGKKNKNRDNDDEGFSQQVVDNSTKFVSYKQQLKMEEAAANKGMPSKASKNLGASSDSDGE